MSPAPECLPTCGVLECAKSQRNWDLGSLLWSHCCYELVLPEKVLKHQNMALVCTMLAIVVPLTERLLLFWAGRARFLRTCGHQRNAYTPTLPHIIYCLGLRESKQLLYVFFFFSKSSHIFFPFLVFVSFKRRQHRNLCFYHYTVHLVVFGEEIDTSKRGRACFFSLGTKKNSSWALLQFPK